jgi:mersacidin/lichenicidin family type 2 lantibiotic
MTKKNRKHEKQSEQQPTPQPIAPAKTLELSDEELEQVVGGCATGEHAPTSIDGLPVLIGN